MKCKHIWREVQANCYFCPKCEADRYYDEILGGEYERANQRISIR
jgi:hypothetical protein